MDLIGGVKFVRDDKPGQTPEDIAKIAHGIELLNDTVTPMGFVVEALQKHLGLEREAATQAMLTVHRHGRVVLAAASRANSVSVSKAIAADARSLHFPLVCRAVGAQ